MSPLSWASLNLFTLRMGTGEAVMSDLLMKAYLPLVEIQMLVNKDNFPHPQFTFLYQRSSAQDPGSQDTTGFGLQLKD